MSIADFMIHLDSEIPLHERTQLESEIGKKDGVVSVCFSPGHLHIMAITYNPDVISSDELLAHVSQRGIVAQKVGL
ncbi:MAG: hypothetical protein ABL868_02775 [Sulfuriferula sp.]